MPSIVCSAYRFQVAIVSETGHRMYELFQYSVPVKWRLGVVVLPTEQEDYNEYELGGGNSMHANNKYIQNFDRNTSKKNTCKIAVNSIMC
jgi:hypothetical protein